MTARRLLMPAVCDFCEAKDAPEYVDGQTKRGPWALMCPLCYARHGIGQLGLGLGQRYAKQESGAYIKVEG